MERRKIHSQVCRPSRTLFASRDSFLAYDLMYVLLLEFSSELVPLCVLHSPHQPVTHVFPHGFLLPPFPNHDPHPHPGASSHLIVIDVPVH